ncbi:hypothetical protein U1Q18_006009 [Sarracenia purpurea var. burkii]
MLFFTKKLIISSSSSSVFLLSMFVLHLLTSHGETAITLPKNIRIPAVIAFGDSIVDQGNNNNINTLVKCNFPPYGKDFTGGKPTGRFTNGKTPADWIAEELGIKELVPAYLDPDLQAMDLPTGVSFASGGTGFDPQTPQLVSVVSLSDQVKMFKEYIRKLKGMVGEDKTNDILSNGLFVLIAGSDDLANTYFTIGIRRLQYDIDSYTDLLVRSASDFIKELYELGVKRLGVFGIPPIGCLPSQRTLGGGGLRECSESYNHAGQLFNTKLTTALSSLNTSLNDAEARVVYVDTYNPIIDIIQNHRKYGFSVVDRGCCGTGEMEVSILCNKLSKTCSDHSAYLFWDSYHPTEKGYKILVNQILRKHIINFF